MYIDLNNPDEFTTENIANLLGSVKDDRHWQVRVNTKGLIYMSEKYGNQNLEGVNFRLETFAQGNDYVGAEAQKCERWVNQVYSGLCNFRDNPSTCSKYDPNA